MCGDALLDGLAEVLPEVEAIGNLTRGVSYDGSGIVRTRSSSPIRPAVTPSEAAMRAPARPARASAMTFSSAPSRSAQRAYALVKPGIYSVNVR
ncbi:hypothetical protein [Streptomyces sp. NBC_01615]|uniref:hypothetical protein n=1 Tax=Streptomyces sp. NBC_01615 TaxID=2975898 RepID=UPI00386AF487